ncbi:MAG: hypothetical protein HZA53_07440 [Planctomycetes bacterium]|nr:hypothetical protein [Planctomycetota bacterium]
MAKAKKNTPLSGAQKVAAFLLTLDKQAASNVLKNVDPKVLPAIAEAMTELDPRFGDETKLRELYQEVTRVLVRRPGPRPQDDMEVETMFEEALGREKTRGVIGKLEERRRHERPFAFVEREPAELTSRALQEESPAVTALVLAHLPADLAAEILSGFKPEPALEVVQRMTNIFPPGFEALDTVAQDLRRRLVELAKEPTQKEPEVRLKSIAQLLTFSEPAIEKSVVEGLANADEAVATQIKEFMFTWNDLSSVDKRGMQKILGSIETRTLAIAMKACPQDVEENIMGNLSVRVRQMVADERELAGPMPMTEVQNARGEIMKNVRALMESGEFKPARAGEELVK